jgi:hypothetical protein
MRVLVGTLLWLCSVACTGTDAGSEPAHSGGAGAFAASGSASVAGSSGTSGGAAVAGSMSSGGAGASSGGAGSGGSVGTGGVSGGSAGAGGVAGQPSAGAAGAATGKVEHRFISGMSDGGPVAVVAADGHIEWQYDLTGEANDAWLLGDGNIVFAYKSGARELTPDKQVVWNYDAPSGSEVHSCQPLAGGAFLIGEAHDGGVGYLRELDAAGKVQKTVTLNVGGNISAHGQFREVRKTSQGTYLVTYLQLGKARELDDTGKLLREFPCGSFVAVRLGDGNTLIACGDDHRVIEVDPQGSVVWQVTEREIPGNQLGFAAGVQRLANGNTVICNWPGHGGLPPGQPQAFELTRDKKLVWQLQDPRLKLVSNLEVVDPDASVAGVVLR